MAQGLEVGNRVHLKLTTLDGETEIEGVVLPSALPDHITIKLVNGYNVSHPLAVFVVLLVCCKLGRVYLQLLRESLQLSNLHICYLRSPY